MELSFGMLAISDVLDESVVFVNCVACRLLLASVQHRLDLFFPSCLMYNTSMVLKQTMLLLGSNDNKLSTLDLRKV